MAEGTWQTICRLVSRRRAFEPDRGDESLKRCLNCWDLTALGVGGTLGIGVYVLVGAVAVKTAGPSIILSFLIAATTSLFAGLCYAELGARVPLAGSAYIYTYVSVGELVAFIVGWFNIIEFTYGAASVARGLGAYIDAVTNNAMSEWFLNHMPINASLGISPYFDLFSFFFVIIIGVVLSFGVRESSMVNNVLSVMNIIVIAFIIIAGAFKADSRNWSIPEELVPPGYGVGGFFPYGWWGMLKGAAICFYGFVGFDVINASGEEVKDPRKTLPLAILSVLFIVFIAYAGVSIVATMLVPYYELVGVASVSVAFTRVGWDWARWIITLGAVFGISTSLFGALFPLPRLLYSMAKDGLFLHWFAKVGATTRSPIIATIIPTVAISLLAACLELEQLVLTMCIGTLCSYTIVAVCVVLLRYRSFHEPEAKHSIMKQIIGRADKRATRVSTTIVNIAIVLFVVMCFAIALVVVYVQQPLIPAIILHVLTIPIVIIMALQPFSDERLPFKTPLVPFIPCISIYTNVHLMAIININTWIRLFIWLLIGVPVYFICMCFYKQPAGKSTANEIEFEPHDKRNGKAPVVVQIVVESPTPPRTLARPDDNMEEYDDMEQINKELKDTAINSKKVEEIIVQEIQIENNEEKEAKIIDLLDQVLQAEEDTYGEVISLKENREEDSQSTVEPNETGIPHRKSLSELSDAGSDASSGNQVLSKYDVIAQVHREDLPRVSEEEEKLDSNDDINDFDDEEITAFNESDTSSRTDESGYSDTIDRPALSESLDDTPVSTIPVPPPLDENYFKNNNNYRKFNTVLPRYSKPEPQEIDDDEVNEPRVSIQSNNSQGDGNIRFGSDRQIKFMSKLNNIFQKTIAPTEDEEIPRRRSHSTGNVAEAELSVNNMDRPSLFLDLKKELLSREPTQNLRPVNAQNTEENAPKSDTSEPEEEDMSMSREDLKNKLENIFAVGGPKLLKPRLMKSNPPTPEESYQTDNSSTESISKLPKMDKNDTLRRQRAKFGEVLNSFRLSMNKDEEV
ncbi:high affinity cationic amino acid transporter 1-like isoform X1 [Helicoverpa zea]|uniref:high affinity cationic amino acid transporter 1-like isoform X1 n=2 Tax=Helicoverpa zea TaxID=7113 RepID=UPI001F57A44B|nr:high affinity cationic amino acid transporter 1-like isoform X1 [Helicoverpa zea]XP_047030357.1 high affinity cationic amino acid transporter 1-like isoform X1 [Helicoverpa zea]